MCVGCWEQEGWTVNDLQPLTIEQLEGFLVRYCVANDYRASWVQRLIASQKELAKIAAERDKYKRTSEEQAAKLEPYIDNKGTTWTVPTAEAYYCACSALIREHLALEIAAEEMIECPACDGRGCAKGQQSRCDGDCANECWVDLWSRIANRQLASQEVQS